VYASLAASADGYLNSRPSSRTKIHSAFDITAAAAASARVSAPAAATTDDQYVISS
jgi:hypothetical protein